MKSLGDLVFDKDKNDQIDRSCKACKNGTLSLKNSFRGGAFIGCSNYPEQNLQDLYLNQKSLK